MAQLVNGLALLQQYMANDQARAMNDQKMQFEPIRQRMLMDEIAAKRQQAERQQQYQNSTLDRLNRQQQSTERYQQGRLAQMAAAQKARQGVGRPDPAPVIKDIIDPQNPSRLISVNAREYRGGTIGDPGVLGVAGREPTAQKKSEQLDVGRGLVDSTIAQLKNSYDTLNEGGGIVNADKSSVGNIGSWIGSSGVGQTFGGMVGTKNQSERNSINMTRPILLRAIMQATGMSAKQVDSNAELKLWLATATDPQKGYDENIKALSNISEKFGSGGFSNKPEAGKKQVKRTGTLNGKKVVEYTDGTVEYQ